VIGNESSGSIFFFLIPAKLAASQKGLFHGVSYCYAFTNLHLKFYHGEGNAPPSASWELPYELHWKCRPVNGATRSL
jgi:hypothetical protein